LAICYISRVDLLEADLVIERSLTPAQKLAQALEVMNAGLRLKKQVLRRENPGASDDDLERIYLAWLFSDE
jgi:hypothetical protein